MACCLKRPTKSLDSNSVRAKPHKALQAGSTDRSRPLRRSPANLPKSNKPVRRTKSPRFSMAGCRSIGSLRWSESASGPTRCSPSWRRSIRFWLASCSAQAKTLRANRPPHFSHDSMPCMNRARYLRGMLRNATLRIRTTVRGTRIGPATGPATGPTVAARTLAIPLRALIQGTARMGSESTWRMVRRIWTWGPGGFCFKRWSWPSL